MEQEKIRKKISYRKAYSMPLRRLVKTKRLTADQKWCIIRIKAIWLIDLINLLLVVSTTFVDVLLNGYVNKMEWVIWYAALLVMFVMSMVLEVLNDSLYFDKKDEKEANIIWRILSKKFRLQ